MEGGEARGVCDGGTGEERGEDDFEAGGVWSCDAGVDVAFGLGLGSLVVIRVCLLSDGREREKGRRDRREKLVPRRSKAGGFGSRKCSERSC